MSALSGFEEQIASLMPAREAAAWRAQLEFERKQKVDCQHQVRLECALAIELAAGAIQRPNIARADIERALVHLTRALSAAAVLDPDDA